MALWPLTSSLITHSLTLPGVFDTVPEAGVVDPPLWTLRYETMCYVLLALFAGQLHGVRQRLAASFGSAAAAK